MHPESTKSDTKTIATNFKIAPYLRHHQKMFPRESQVESKANYFMSTKDKQKEFEEIFDLDL
jgi:hypothetical protein